MAFCWIVRLSITGLWLGVAMTSEVKNSSYDPLEAVNGLPESDTTIAKINRLKDKLLTGYRKDTLPINNRTQDFVVDFEPMLISVGDLNEVEEMLTVVLYVSYSWIDDSIHWDMILNDGISSVHLDHQLMWKPIYHVYNIHHAMANAKDMGQEDKITYFYSGKAIWLRRHIMYSTCNLDITYFPFDVQSCQIVLTSDDLIVIKVLENNYLEFYEDNGAWALVDFKVTYKGYAQIYMDFTLRRKPLFFVVNVLLPIAVLAFLTPMVFMLPKDSGERVGYSVTVLLAISVYMTILSDNLPTTSDPMPLLSILLLIFYITTATIGLIVILNFKILKAKECRPVPLLAKRFVVITRCLFGCSPCRNSPIAQVTLSEQQVETERCLSENGDKKTEETTNSGVHRPDIRWIDVSNSVDLVCMLSIYLVEFGLFITFYVGCSKYNISKG